MGNDDKVLRDAVLHLARIAKDHEKRLLWLERGATLFLGGFAVFQIMYHQ